MFGGFNIESPRERWVHIRASFGTMKGNVALTLGFLSQPKLVVSLAKAQFLLTYDT